METILVQETDAATLEVLTVALQMEGFKVYGATDSNENILEMIRRYHPKLVLLDCWLSEYSGKRICQWIKSHFPRLPVIVLSCDNQIGAHYRELGFAGYLKKPFGLELLNRVIRKHLPARRNKRSLVELC